MQSSFKVTFANGGVARTIEILFADDLPIAFTEMGLHDKRPVLFDLDQPIAELKKVLREKLSGEKL